jgi:uncharacterized membrane protein
MEEHSPLTKALLKIRAFFFSGVLVTAPLLLTLYLIWSTVVALDTFLTGLLPPIPYLSVFPGQVPGLGLILAACVFTLIGWMTKGLFGKWIVGISERLVHKMPVIRSLYKTLKQIFEALFEHNKSSFRQVVMLEYPRSGIWAVGFTTGPAPDMIQGTSPDELVNVFIPTTPNPTSGFLLFVPSKDLRLLPISVEEGIKLVVSIGLVGPGEEKAE